MLDRASAVLRAGRGRSSSARGSGPDGPALDESSDACSSRPSAICGCTSRAWAPTTSAAVPVIVRGEGCYVYDEHGKRYLDGLSALYCVNVGHGRAELGEAAARQAQGARLLHELELRAPALDRAGGADRRARARATSTACSSPPAARRRSSRRGSSRRPTTHARGEHTPAQADLAQARLPRHLDGRADGDRADAAARRRSNR